MFFLFQSALRECKFNCNPKKLNILSCIQIRILISLNRFNFVDNDLYFKENLKPPIQKEIIIIQIDHLDYFDPLE